MCTTMFSMFNGRGLSRLRCTPLSMILYILNSYRSRILGMVRRSSVMDRVYPMSRLTPTCKPPYKRSCGKQACRRYRSYSKTCVTPGNRTQTPILDIVRHTHSAWRNDVMKISDFWPNIKAKHPPMSHTPHMSRHVTSRHVTSHKHVTHVTHLPLR
jgi:hypothetical protein